MANIQLPPPPPNSCPAGQLKRFKNAYLQGISVHVGPHGSVVDKAEVRIAEKLGAMHVATQLLESAYQGRLMFDQNRIACLSSVGSTEAISELAKNKLATAGPNGRRSGIASSFTFFIVVPMSNV